MAETSCGMVDPRRERQSGREPAERPRASDPPRSRHADPLGPAKAGGDAWPTDTCSLPSPLCAAGGRLLAQHGLAAELDAVLVVDGDDLDLHLVADLAHVGDAGDVLVGQLADVAQPVLARQDLDEGAEILDAGHAAFVDPADLHPGGQGLDAAAGPPRRLQRTRWPRSPCRRPRPRSWPRWLPGCADRLSARTDQQADLLRVDVRPQQPRRPLGDARPRAGRWR